MPSSTRRGVSDDNRAFFVARRKTPNYWRLWLRHGNTCASHPQVQSDRDPSPIQVFPAYAQHRSQNYRHSREALAIRRWDRRLASVDLAVENRTRANEVALLPSRHPLFVLPLTVEGALAIRRRGRQLASVNFPIKSRILANEAAHLPSQSCLFVSPLVHGRTAESVRAASTSEKWRHGNPHFVAP